MAKTVPSPGGSSSASRGEETGGGTAENRSYVTVISTDAYVKGALVLRESLRRVGAKYALLAILTEGVSRDNESLLARFDIRTRRVDAQIVLPESTTAANTAMGFPHWNNTFGKLHIFDLVDFAKIVYLDSDLLVMANIDHLFERPHMSAVAAGKSYPGNTHWEGLNSGLMVVEPETGLVERIVATIPGATAERSNIGDQDVLQQFYREWPTTPALHLDEGYNIFQMYVDYYRRHEKYRFHGRDHRVYVVHFVGATKPWMMTFPRRLRSFVALALRRRMCELMVTIFYDVLLLEMAARSRFRR